MEIVLIEDGYKFYDITEIIPDTITQTNCDFEKAIELLMKLYNCDKAGIGRNFSVAYQNLLIMIHLNKA